MLSDWTLYLDTILYFINHFIEERAMTQVVSRRPLNAEARVRTRANPCGIYGG
jgi:hypothetical protein